MNRPPSSLPNRLRRHRGVWLLAMFALLIKLTAATVCLADSLPVQAAVATVATMTFDSAQSAAIDKAVDVVPGGCVLDEIGGCHCACAHSAALPSIASLPIAMRQTNFDFVPILPEWIPAEPGSQLRPPIA